MTGKFRKKPVVIEAWRFDPQSQPPAWFSDACDTGVVWYRPWRQDGPAPYLLIQTLEGEMRANVGDWIILGVEGEIYPCKPAIFAATYEPVE